MEKQVAAVLIISTQYQAAFICTSVTCNILDTTIKIWTEIESNDESDRNFVALHLRVKSKWDSLAQHCLFFQTLIFWLDL